MKSIGLAQDGDNLCAFVKTVVNISFRKMGVIFILNEKVNIFKTQL